jgi:C-terminal processing protease CtpA/Prc
MVVFLVAPDCWCCIGLLSLSLMQTLFMKLLSCLILCISFSANLLAQKKYSEEELGRIADLGRIWGMVHYFHPSMGSGSIATDSLIVDVAEKLAKNPTEANYKECLATMLNRLNDPATTIQMSNQKGSVTIAQKSGTTIQYRVLQGNVLYVALPSFFTSEAMIEKVMDLVTRFSDYSGLIFDLRNPDYSNYDAMTSWEFSQVVMLGLADELAGAVKIPALMERTAFYNGFMSQTNTNPNVYSCGWKTNVVRAEKQSKGAAYNKPVLFILSPFCADEVITQVLQLKAAGIAKVVVEGNEQAMGLGKVINIPARDGLNVKLRVSDYYLAKGNLLPQPDAFLPAATDTSSNSTFFKSLLQHLNTPAINSVVSKNLNWNFDYPKPGRYTQNLYPSLGLRVMAAYNWFNAIEYFFPYKHLMDKPWLQSYYSHLPQFINAADSLQYMLAMRAFVAAINDSHGFISNENKITPARAAFGYWPPVELAFVEDRLWVVDFVKDSLTTTAPLELWDEVVAINGKNIREAVEEWRTYFASSNESTFKRDVSNYLLNGPLNTSVIIDVVRNGKKIKITLIRSGRIFTNRNLIEFNDNYKTAQWLKEGVAYINMGALTPAKVDSVMKAFDNAKAIVFDIRNYPQGTAWSIAPRLTTKEKKAVLFDKPYVTYDHINGGEDKSSMSSYFTVNPASRSKAFKGKVFMICNEQTQSQAEYTIMMFQGAKDVTVVGSQTAGADGNVTSVALPGGYEAWFSGLGILYPDGKPTQRTGIRVDVLVKPTVAGLKSGKDELLEKVIQLAGL